MQRDFTYVEDIVQDVNRVLDRPPDVAARYAETAALQADVGFVPSTSITEGIGRFVDWYRSCYRAR